MPMPKALLRQRFSCFGASTPVARVPYTTGSNIRSDKLPFEFLELQHSICLSQAGIVNEQIGNRPGLKQGLCSWSAQQASRDNAP